jgi:hypothetical protein
LGIPIEQIFEVSFITVFYFTASALATLDRKLFDPGLLTERFTIISTGLTALP